ncbi:MAG: hypothetical protein ACUVSU_13375 [Aggregatilineaceae bacterium]
MSLTCSPGIEARRILAYPDNAAPIRCQNLDGGMRDAGARAKHQQAQRGHWHQDAPILVEHLDGVLLTLHHCMFYVQIAQAIA